MSFFTTNFFSNGLSYKYNLGVFLQKWDTGVDVDKGKGPEGKKNTEKMSSAVFSISNNFIPNGDMFGILNNISEFVQKSIMSS